MCLIYKILFWFTYNFLLCFIWINLIFKNKKYLFLNNISNKYSITRYFFSAIKILFMSGNFFYYQEPWSLQWLPYRSKVYLKDRRQRNHSKWCEAVPSYQGMELVLVAIIGEKLTSSSFTYRGQGIPIFLYMYIEIIP